MRPMIRRLLFLAVLLGALVTGTAALAAPPRPIRSDQAKPGPARGTPLAVPAGRWELPKAAPNPPALRPSPAPAPVRNTSSAAATSVAVLAAATVAAATLRRPQLEAARPAPASRVATPPPPPAPPARPPAPPPTPPVRPPAAPPPAPQPQRPLPLRAELAERQDQQRKAGVAPVVLPASKPTTVALNQQILQAKAEYDHAREQGNAGGMAAAHQRAEWLRQQGGTYGADQSINDVHEQQKTALNAGIVQAKADHAEAATRGDQAGMAAAHARAEDLRRQGGGIATSEPLADAKLHLQAGVDRQVAAEKERHAAGTAAQQALAQRRAEEMRQLARAQGVAVTGAEVSLVEARERALAEANRQVVLDKAAHERARLAGDTASMAVLHRDAEAQRQAGASIGAHETVAEAREHLQRHLDEGIVVQKDAYAGHASPSAQEQAHRRAEALRQVGQSLGLGTIGQDVSLADAQVHLVLGGGPLVAGGKRTDVKASDVERLRYVQAGVTAGAPNADEMRSAYRELLARSRTGDVSAIAALAVLQRQADKANVQLNPPPPPRPPRPAPVQRPSAVGSGGLSGEDVRLRTHEAVTAETNRFVTLNAGEAARLRAYDGVATPCPIPLREQVDAAVQGQLDELTEMWEQNQRLAALYIVPEGALLKGAAVAVDGLKAAAVAVEKTEAAATLGTKVKGVVASVGEWLGVRSATAVESAGATLSPVQLRQQAILDGAPGYNISPLSTMLEHRTVGKSGTYLTDARAIEQILGPLPEGVDRITITSEQAMGLEWALGLEEATLQGRSILSKVTHVAERAPQSPFAKKMANRFFRGPGKGLPGGGPEVTVSAIPSAGGSNIIQILVEVK